MKLLPFRGYGKAQPVQGAPDPSEIQRAQLLDRLHDADHELAKLAAQAHTLRSQYTLIAPSGDLVLRSDDLTARQRADQQWRETVNEAAHVVQRRSQLMQELAGLRPGGKSHE
jgi:hypothetical protein